MGFSTSSTEHRALPSRSAPRPELPLEPGPPRAAWRRLAGAYLPRLLLADPRLFLHLALDPALLAEEWARAAREGGEPPGPAPIGWVAADCVSTQGRPGPRWSPTEGLVLAGVRFPGPRRVGEAFFLLGAIWPARVVLRPAPLLEAPRERRLRVRCFALELDRLGRAAGTVLGEWRRVDGQLVQVTLGPGPWPTQDGLVAAVRERLGVV